MREIILVLVMAILAGCYPTKVIDPSDPRFDPMKFDFSDYPRDKHLAEALRVILKRGMPKKDVEKILVVAGNSRAVDMTGQKVFGNYLEKDEDFQSFATKYPSIVAYQKGGVRNTSSGWLLYAFYDNEKLIQIYVRRIPVFTKAEGN